MNLCYMLQCLLNYWISTMKYKHLIIDGKVQGVGYRYSAKSKANSLKIKGSVENMPNGTVEIYCLGSDENIDAYINYLKNNPGWSHVDNIEIEDIEERNIKEKLEMMTEFVID